MSSETTPRRQADSELDRPTDKPQIPQHPGGIVRPLPTVLCRLRGAELIRTGRQLDGFCAHRRDGDQEMRVASADEEVAGLRPPAADVIRGNNPRRSSRAA